MARDQRETHESFKRKQTTEKWRLWRFWLSLLVENIDNFLSRTVFISPALLYYFILSDLLQILRAPAAFSFAVSYIIVFI